MKPFAPVTSTVDGGLMDVMVFGDVSYRGQIDAMGEKSVVLRNRGVQLENKCQEKAVWWELTERCSG